MTREKALLICTAVLLAACADDPAATVADPDAGHGADAGSFKDSGAPVADSGRDAGGDTGSIPDHDDSDGSPADTLADAAPDAEPDAGFPEDAGFDAGQPPDGGQPADAGTDAGFDGGTDAGHDAGTPSQFSPSLADLWSGAARFVADPSFGPPAELYGHAETCTVPFGGKHLMFYRTFVNQPGGSPAIALASSDDGDNWTAHNAGNPVVPRGGAPGNADDGYLIAPSVHSDGTTLTMVYEAWNGTGKQTVAAATSADGVAWTKLGTVIPAASSGWEKGNTGTPSLNLVDGTWFVFYHGFRGTDGTGALARGFASGKSVASVAKHGAPVLTGKAGTWTDVGIGRGDIVEDVGHYYMVYEGARGSALCTAQAQYGWGIARSKDLVSWEEWQYNPVLTDIDGSCGNDMPAWQVIGSRAMVVTTKSDTNGVRRVRLDPSVGAGVALAAYEAESQLDHQTGHADGGDWVATAPGDKAGALVYGPYVTDLAPGVAEARFRIGGGGAPGPTVLATLDVNDNNENRARAQREVTASMLPASGYVEIALPFLVPPDPHRLEFRVWYKGTGTVRVDKVTIVTR
ncbi:MAG: hypothetical protein HY897_04155 [Deltaproteobacteria bacterium]|nr:hypothetical protein [Deltaproteobacteria bacterium]